jgi:hypothetical protein
MNRKIRRPSGTLQSAGAARVGHSGTHLIERRLGILFAECGIRCLSGGQSPDKKHRYDARNRQLQPFRHVNFSPADLIPLYPLYHPADDLARAFRGGVSACSPRRTTLVVDGAPAPSTLMAWGKKRQSLQVSIRLSDIIWFAGFVSAAVHAQTLLIHH